MDKVSEAVLAYMRAQVGKAQYSRTYRMKAGYYDCASFVYRAYKEGAGVKLTVEHSTSMYEVYAKEFRLLWPAKASDIGKKFAPKDILQQLGVKGGEHVFGCFDLDTKRFNKITHVWTVLNNKQIIHARNTDKDVCIDPISYGTTRICAVVEYISTKNEEDDMVVNKNSSPEAIGAAQLLLFAAGFPGKMDKKLLKTWGPNTEGALELAQKAFGLPVKAEMDDKLFFALVGAAPDETAYQDTISRLNTDLATAHKDIDDIAAYAAEKAKK